MSARRHLLSFFFRSPLSPLFFFNHLRTLSFYVSHLSPIPPAPSALFAQKPGCTPFRLYQFLLGPSLATRHSIHPPTSHQSPVTNHQSLPRTHKRHRCRRPQRAPATLQCAGGTGE